MDDSKIAYVFIDEYGTPDLQVSTPSATSLPMAAGINVNGIGASRRPSAAVFLCEGGVSDSTS